jgi:hypothetical protein
MTRLKEPVRPGHDAVRRRTESFDGVRSRPTAQGAVQAGRARRTAGGAPVDLCT